MYVGPSHRLYANPDAHPSRAEFPNVGRLYPLVNYSYFMPLLMLLLQELLQIQDPAAATDSDIRYVPRERLRRWEVPEIFIGYTFGDLFRAMLADGLLALGLHHTLEGGPDTPSTQYVLTAPPYSLVIGKHDAVFVLVPRVNPGAAVKPQTTPAPGRMLRSSSKSLFPVTLDASALQRGGREPLGQRSAWRKEQVRGLNLDLGQARSSAPSAAPSIVRPYRSASTGTNPFTSNQVPGSRSMPDIAEMFRAPGKPEPSSKGATTATTGRIAIKISESIRRQRNVSSPHGLRLTPPRESKDGKKKVGIDDRMESMSREQRKGSLASLRSGRSSDALSAFDPARPSSSSSSFTSRHRKSL